MGKWNFVQANFLPGSMGLKPCIASRQILPLATPREGKSWGSIEGRLFTPEGQADLLLQVPVADHSTLKSFQLFETEENISVASGVRLTWVQIQISPTGSVTLGKSVISPSLSFLF